MKKAIAIFFGLLVVATSGLVAATVWEVTAVHEYNQGTYGWAYAEVGVKCDVQHPYTHYYITYWIGSGGLTEKGKDMGYYALYYYYYPDNSSVTTTIVKPSQYSYFAIETDTATAGWPYI